MLPGSFSSVLADRDGEESLATAVARVTAVTVVCHPTAVGGDFREYDG